jgi:hypothetical protein
LHVNVFDQSARYSVQSDPLGFFRWVVPGLDPSLRFHGWLDTRTLPFPGEPDRTCDTVANLSETPETGPRWAFVTEFQTEPEADMLDRLLEYLARLRRGLRFGPGRREKYHVAAALVSLTGPPQTAALEMILPGLASPTLRFNAAVRTLRDEDAGATLDQIATGQTSRCILSWISLMRGGGAPDIIERWKQVASQESDNSRRAAYGAIALIFADLTGRVDQWRSGLEGWNMRDSTVVAEWKAEGRAEGKAEGRAEGRAEGIAKTRRGDLLRLLELKFRATVPADLMSAVETQTDLDVLARWFDAAVLADSLDAFRAAIA